MVDCGRLAVYNQPSVYRCHQTQRPGLSSTHGGACEPSVHLFIQIDEGRVVRPMLVVGRRPWNPPLRAYSMRSLTIVDELASAGLLRYVDASEMVSHSLRSAADVCHNQPWRWRCVRVLHTNDRWICLKFTRT